MAAAATGSGAKGGTSPSELAAMLRKSAEIVERRDFHPLLYQTMKALTAYAGDYAHGGGASKSATTSNGSNTQRQKEDAVMATQAKTKSAFHDVPDSLLESKQPQKAAGHHRRYSGGGSAGAAKKMGATGGQFSSAASSASGKSQEKQHKGGFTKGLKGIRKGFEKLGADFIGDKDNDDIPFDEQGWCKNTEPTKNSVEQPESSPARPTHESEKKAKPCFQRPINPNSNLIANGWIEQQRRSKMRVVWKDVLASLVEGRRPGEETTLWIQRQVIDPQTGKITGLEALHQIPMKWLEDVNYVDVYGDYRFTLKVYNFSEEFYFRTRDEQSAQSWVITLRSARDASLESIGRKPNDEDKWMRKESPPKEMGLDSLEVTEKSPVVKPSPHIDAPTAQAGNDSPSEQNGTSPAQPQQQPQTNGRMKISELRAIAHGAGYDTRGMERKDLEKIAAIVNGSVPASSAPAEGSSDALRHSKEQEAMMRDAERRQREELEQRERREREEQERAETLRREQEAQREKMAAEQRRQQEEARQRQIEDIKRRQEEERLKRIAEIQAAEAKRKQEEENIRREQQQRAHIPTPPTSTHIPTPPSSGGAPFHQQQQHHQQQQQRSHIPSPPNSGGTPFQQQQWGQPQQQQQYHQWQQQQQQQQHPQQHAQYQQQAYANQHQPQQSQNPQFFSGYQQPNFQQQQHHHQQQQQQQQQQQPPQQPPPQQQQQHHHQQQHAAASDSKYAKQMEEKTDEEQSAANTQIKRSILINWALQPPNLNMLRPIDQLITSIHTAMPPAFGVPGHTYFSKFTPIVHSDLVVSAAMGNHPDENKLKKAVRKVRVFLHPDKLPRDLSTEQSFMARMLWDITSDSWEEFLKHKDELDWIQS